MKIKYRIIWSFLLCFFGGLLIYGAALFACLGFDLLYVIYLLNQARNVYLLLIALGIVTIFALSRPLSDFSDSYESGGDISNERALFIQKTASFFPYRAAFFLGNLILAGGSINGLFVFNLTSPPLWQVFTFPACGFIAALIIFLFSFSFTERILYDVREMADQKNTLPSLEHPGPSLFLKLFMQFLTFGASLVLFIGLFINNSIMFGYEAGRLLQIVRTTTLAFIGAGLILSFAISSSFAGITLLPLRKLGNYLKAISTGDLTRRLLSGASDELYSICRSASYMVNSLKLMVLRARDMGSDITNAAKNIKFSEEQQAEGAIKTARTMAGAISTLRNLADSAKEVHSSAERVAGAARATLSSSNSSAQAIAAIKNEMENIKSKVEDTLRRISALEDRSHQISAIAIMIGEITEQTNLLSVNASIEASRAGAAGKGFSQVAVSISKLAERVANSSREIAALIAEIQADTHLTVGVTRDSTASIEKSVGNVEKAAGAISEINQMIIQTSNAAQQILDASTEQKNQTGKIVASISGWSEVAKQFEESTHHLVDSAKKLNQLSEDLKGAISGFKVETNEK